jgi:hypothetical protein
LSKWKKRKDTKHNRAKVHAVTLQTQPEAAAEKVNGGLLLIVELGGQGGRR